VTFQTPDRKAITHEAVPAEFDRLVARLSDEIIDRLSEEPDGVARIAIFGLPGQMALLRDNVGGLPAPGVRTHALQDQRHSARLLLHLGHARRHAHRPGAGRDQQPGMGGFAAGFMSGRGKSFFIHDLLRG
jgi:type VI secretion system protein ImpL